MRIFICILMGLLISLPADAHRAKHVRVVNKVKVKVMGPVDVTGSSVTIDNHDANAVPVRPVTERIPFQVLLTGVFSNFSINLGQSGTRDISYTIPDGFDSALVKYVSCRVIQEPDVTVVINLNTSFSYDTFGIPGQEIVKLITSPDDRVIISPAARFAESAMVHAWLGITTPDGPDIGDTLTLSAQRSTNQGSGGVSCVVTGELIP